MNFNNFFTIFRRELAAYFTSAIAYIFIIVFALLNGALFMTQFFLYGAADMRPFFSTLPFILAVFLPAVTMRLWAEEKRGNTLELLLTFPMGTRTLVLGKFFAGVVFYLSALAGTLTIPLMMKVIGNPDLGAVFGGYAGAALLGSLFLAVGIFLSGLCRDQIVAFILSMMVCFGLHLTGTEFFASSIDGWLPGAGTFLRYFIGSASHSATFEKGVIDNSDVLYFLIGTVVFLVLNGFWFEGRMRPGAKKVFTVATLISVGIFLLSNWLFADLPLGRFDLTQGKIYTIAPATKKILRELGAPVTAKFYVSPADKMPTGMKTLEQDVVDKLEELRVASGGKFQFKIFHMEAANVVDPAQKKEGKEDSLEQQLQSKGINPFQVRAIESDEVNVRLVYAAVSLAYKEKAEEIIPQLMPDNLHELEYLLVSKIYRMNLEKKPSIAMAAPYQEKEVDPQVAQLLEQLGGQAPQGYREDAYEFLQMALEYEGYEVNRIKLDQKEPIPDSATTLVVAEPAEFNDRQRYEINRFLVQGGRVFLAVQNFQYQYQPQGNELSIYPQERKPQVNPLLREWGLEVDENILLDEQHDVINLSGAVRMGPFDVSIPVKIPTQILITSGGMNQDISVTSRLSSMFYLWGTALKIDEEKAKAQNLKIQTLLKSSPASWTVPFKPGYLVPADLQRKPESRVGPFPLAVFATGQFADAFKDQPRPSWPAEGEARPEGRPEEKQEDVGAQMGSDPIKTPGPAPTQDHADVGAIHESPLQSLKPAEGKLILVGAATPFQKHLVQGGGNLNFFLNSVDALSLGDELVTIRSKQPVNRGLGRISAPAKVGWRIFVTFLVPLLFAAIGGAIVFLRGQSKKNYLKKYALSS